MHKIQLDIDNSIFDEFIKLIDKLPKDKVLITDDKILSDKHDINDLLERADLLHFSYYEEDKRILYTHDTGTPQQKHDFGKLVKILREHKIKYTAIGLDILMIEN